MSKKIKISAIILLLLLLISCKKEVPQLILCIENHYPDSLIIELYPKSEYMDSLGITYFRNLDYHGTEGIEPKYYLGPNHDVASFLLTTSMINSTPTELMNMVFDSVIMKLDLENLDQLIFKSDYAINYERNIFSDEDSWRHEFFEGWLDDRASFQRPYYLSDIYFFDIYDSLIHIE